MARLARRASTTTGCEKLGRRFTVGLNGVSGSGLVLDDLSEDSLQDTEGTAAAAASKIWDSHPADMSQLRRNTFTALSIMIDVRAATCATPATKSAARKNVHRLDAAQCYITG